MSIAVSVVLAGLCLLAPEGKWQAELDRLIGQSVQVSESGYDIIDIAGEGTPHVGCVRRVGKALYLESGQKRWRLTGPLALPRIAGPNYKVWVVGDPTPAMTLPARRLGILAPPEQSICGVQPAKSPAHPVAP
jgi:hypothetical protein